MGVSFDLNDTVVKIGSAYTQAEERRLHYLVSMALLTIAQNLRRHTSVRLLVPRPFCNLLTEADIYRLHNQYTSDINIWFDGVNFQVSSSLAISGIPVPTAPTLRVVTLQPQISTPGGQGSAPPNHQRRQTRRSAKRATVKVILDPVLSERAEIS